MAKSPKNKAGFQELYRKTYSALGIVLRKSDGFSEAAIKKAEKKIGVLIPRPLRDYYLVAGKEKRFNTIFNVLLTPEDCEVHRGKLAFMTENQCVVVWGVSLKDKRASDPEVFQNVPVDGELRQWHDEKSTCSQFLVFMLHLQSAYGGGMPHCASAAVPAETVSLLDKNWSFGGEVRGMRTYHKPGQSICFVKWGTEWRIFAGAQEEKMLQPTAEELKIEWEKR